MQFKVSNAWKHDFKLVFHTKHNMLAKICSNGYVQSLFSVYFAFFFLLGSLRRVLVYLASCSRINKSNTMIGSATSFWPWTIKTYWNTNYCLVISIRDAFFFFFAASALFSVNCSCTISLWALLSNSSWSYQVDNDILNGLLSISPSLEIPSFPTTISKAP